VAKYGCQFESFEVTTADGYILSVYHIWTSAKKAGAPVVFLQHGLFSSADWFVVSSNQSYAFQLAKMGYDVWLGNNRGTKYSRTHTKYNIKDNRADREPYFDYSFFELGQYDVPAQINFVLKTTGKSTLSYIGHSQGTSQMFTALTYNFGNIRSKVNLFVALAPITNVGHTTYSAIQTFAKYEKALLTPLRTMYLFEVSGRFEDIAGGALCYIVPCSLLNFLAPSKYNNPDYEAIYGGRASSGASFKQLQHYAQIVEKKEFAQFDYEATKNKEMYGQYSPPLIDLTKIQGVPIALYVGLQDPLGDPTDARNLRDILKTNVVGYMEINNFDHHSFNVGKDLSY
jgi:pimeloyl-ACP methyl ester carboxylesterase